MKFFKKLIGKDEPAAPASPSSTEGDPIRVYDNYGRELLIPRKEWLKVLFDNLQKVWNSPDELSGHIVQGLQDGFDAEMEDAAKQLQRIDPNKERSSTLLAVIYLQTKRPKQAQVVLMDHIKRHGESGVVLTNLAKAESALGDEEKSLATLWRAMELDPNQENGMGWYEVIHREKNGEAAGLDALKRVAAIPTSWRAQLWIARHALSQGQLDQALELYRQSLDRAPKPTPADLLTQLSGDLGNTGHLIQLLDLTVPHFDVQHHGLQVGNNLIKAAIDTGQLDLARQWLDQLQVQQRPDWRETLGFWEAELHKARLSIMDPLPKEKLNCSLLSIEGALWLPEDHAVRSHFPAKAEDAPHIVLIGSTFESNNLGNEVKIGPVNNTGRYSRALPLLFSEHIYLRSPARTTTLIPWITNGAGGFALSGKPYDDAALVEQARQATASGSHPADYVLYSHLIVRGENVTLQFRLLRCIDGKLLAESSHPFPEIGFYHAASSAFTDLCNLLSKHAEVSVTSNKPTLEGSELDHYLLRLEQTLAVGCSTMEERYATSLSNPAEILDGMLHLSLQNPKHLPSRMILLRTLRKLRKPQAQLTSAIRTKVEKLFQEFPIVSVQTELNHELLSVFDEKH